MSTFSFRFYSFFLFLSPIALTACRQFHRCCMHIAHGNKLIIFEHYFISWIIKLLTIKLLPKTSISSPTAVTFVAKAAKAATTAAGSRNYIIAAPTTASAAVTVDTLQAADALNTVAVTKALPLELPQLLMHLLKQQQQWQSWQRQIKQQ